MSPKINVYLPDELAAEVKAAGIPVSAVCQQALADAVANQGVEASGEDSLTRRAAGVVAAAREARPATRRRSTWWARSSSPGGLALAVLEAADIVPEICATSSPPARPATGAPDRSTISSHAPSSRRAGWATPTSAPSTCCWP